MLTSRISKAMKNMRRTVWVLLILTPMVVLAAPTGSELANNAPAGMGSQVMDLANNAPEGAGSEVRNFVGDKSVEKNGEDAADSGVNLPFGQGAGVPDIVTMLLNLDKSFPALIYMVSAMAYLFGFGLMLKAIWGLKQYTLGVSMTAQNSMHPIIMQLAVGVALVFLPSTLKAVLATVYGTDVPTLYKVPDSSWKVASDTLILFVQFIGLIAIVRGLLHLHKASHGQAQQNSFAKGIIHLIGGTLSLNIIQTKDILYSTLGLTT